MSKNLIKATQQTSITPTRQKVLDLSKAIIAGTAQLAHYEMGLTVADTLQQPPIRSVFKGENGQIAYTVMRVLSARFLEAFGFSTKLTDEQIDIFTVDALEHFEYESLDDVLLFFKMARQGKFGTAKHSIDSNMVWGDWFPKYLEEKMKLKEELYLRKKDTLNANPINIEAVKKVYQQAEKRKKRQAIENEIDEHIEHFNRQMLEDMIVEWSKDKDKKQYVPYLKRKRLKIKE